MICGLLGEKLIHSYSPQIHKYLGDYSYDLYERSPEALEDFLLNGQFDGLNVTIPYKKSVLKFCSDLSPQAKMLGAVNTIIRRADGKLYGHNTDYFGFRSMALHSGYDFSNKKILVLGSGGASNTVCAVMEELGGNVFVISRSGESNYQNLHIHTDCSVIVNATPVGMYPHNGTSPVNIDLFPNLEYVMDLIYNPAKTKLLLDAEARGIPSQNGLWMLVAQAAESSYFFTGQTIDSKSIESIYSQLNLQMRNIVLIGMPGCGKSTIGRLLSEKLKRCFYDSDKEVERSAGRSIPEIFQADGEDGFRKTETAILRKLAKLSSCVIATGGGCVTKEENLPILRQNAFIIWIQRDISLLPTEGRPLSRTNSLNQMYQVRQPLYHRFADIVVENDNSPEVAVQSIIKQLEDRI